MRVALATTLTLAMLSPAMAGVRVIDGDTVDIDGTRIRILSIDTPETFRSRCENELVLGLKATERLRELLSDGEVSYTPDGVDRFGRTLAHVYAGDVDVGQQLLDEGHALPYVPGPEAKAKRLATWCPTGKKNKHLTPAAARLTGVEVSGMIPTETRHSTSTSFRSYPSNRHGIQPAKKTTRHRVDAGR